MMKFLKFTTVFMATILLASCLKKEELPEPVVDYGGITNYYIVNNSGLDLNVIYKIAPTPIEADSTVLLPIDAVIQIFRYGGLGGHFPPSYVFGNLIFYTKADFGKENPLMTIDPVDDDNWKDLYKAGDSVRSYELIITPENVK